jgi:hypothetical protein
MLDEVRMMVDHVLCLGFIYLFWSFVLGFLIPMFFSYSGGTLWECGKVRVGYMESGPALCGSLILLITSG